MGRARVFKWHVLLALLLLGLAIWAGIRYGLPWRRDASAGTPLEYQVLAVAELPLPLIETYGHKRWSPGVDVYPGRRTGEIFVLVRWGQCPSGGYRIEPAAVRLVRRFLREEIIVDLRYIEPAPGQPVIEVVTFPAVGLRIRATDRSLAGCYVVTLNQDGRATGKAGPLR